MLANSKDVSLSESLKLRFLYLNDINSVNLLINLYQSQDNFTDLYPSYTTKSKLRKYIKRQMRGTLGNDLAAKNLADIIHSDINRFELLMHLEGYKAGFHSHKDANMLEELLLKDLSIKDLYDKKLIKDQCLNNKQIQDYKEGISAFIKKEIVIDKTLKRIISTYMRKIIRPKIFNLNQKSDVQLIMETDKQDGRVYFSPEPRPFSKRELSGIYRKISTWMFRLAIDIYIQAYWLGIIEKVKKRYK